MAIGTPVNSTSFNAALKEIYPVDRIEQEILDGADDPFVKSWHRIEDGGGYQWRLPVATSTNVRVGASFATAQSLGSNQKNQAFLITYNQIYAVASWSGPVLQASMGDKNAFESVVTQEMELAIAALNNKIATQAYRTGTGSITQVAVGYNVSASVTSSGGTQYPLGLLNTQDVLMFEVGDVVVFSQTDGGSLRTGTALITGIDLNQGTLLSTATWSSSITSLANTDYIYRTAADASAGSTAVVMQGFQSWCPPNNTTITSSDSFFGVNRSSYKAKLAGLFYDNTTNQDSVAEALVNACSLVQSAGAAKKLDLVVLHPQEMKKLVNDTSTKVVVGSADVKLDKAKIGLSNFSLMTDWGAVPLAQSIFQVPGFASLISTSTWHLITSGKPGVQEVDGIMALRVSTDDAYEARLAAVNIALGCSAPGWNCIVKF